MPSQIFLIETIPGFLLLLLSMLYIVELLTPALLATALTAMSRSLQSSFILFAIASFVFTADPPSTIYRISPPIF